MKLTKESARSFLRGRFVIVNGHRAESEAIRKLRDAGFEKDRDASNNMGFPYAIVISETTYDYYQLQYIPKPYTEIFGHDLLSIEIIDENPLKMNPEGIWKEKYEDAVKLLVGDLSLLKQTEAHRKAIGVTFGNIFLESQIEQIEKFLAQHNQETP